MKEEVVDKIFSRCEEIDIQLDKDPIRRGPNYLNKMVAKCRNATTEIQKYKRAILREKQKLQRSLNRKETEKELRFNDLMANDDRVTKRSSKSDREAKANNILSDLNSEIRDLESEITDLEHVEEVVESKLRELRDVNRDIRLQKRLIEDEIDTGSFWGEDNTDSGKDVDKSEAEFDMSELLEEEDMENEPEDDEVEEIFGEDSDSDIDEESEDESEESDSGPEDSEEPETSSPMKDDIDFDDFSL